MNICVLNGSPKGQKSITLQSIKYLQKMYSSDNFEIFDVGQKIKAFEDNTKVDMIKNGILNADLIILAYPVYTFLVPSQLQHMMEIILENGINFAGKPLTQLTTSMRFYDVTAHGYVKELSKDLGATYIDGLSMDMQGLLKASGRDELVDWWNFVTFQVKNGMGINVICCSGKPLTYNFNNDKIENLIENNDVQENISKCKLPILSEKKVVIIRDIGESKALNNAISDFCFACKNHVEVVNLTDMPCKCGCLGCMRCTTTGKCAINDGFQNFLNEKVNSADAIVYAFKLTHHAFSARMKMFFDRQFCNGHRPVNVGKPTANIIDGDISVEANFCQYLNARASVGGNIDCGIIDSNNATYDNIKDVAYKISYVMSNSMKPSKNFYEVGGMKIFRDMIWTMRGLMKEDYKFYKDNGLLDFPQKHCGQMVAMKIVGNMMKSNFLKKKLGSNFIEDGMLMPYKKLIYVKPDEKSKRK